MKHLSLLWVLFVPCCAVAADRATPDRRPNIVLIVSDDQTYSDFGFMGNRQVRTPHIDRLAEQSARYVNGYVPSSVCRPSLVTLLTGLYPHQHGVHFNHPPPGFSQLTKSPAIDKRQYDRLREQATELIRAVPTLPRILAQHGYRSLQTGKYWEGHWRNAGFTAGMTTAEPSGGPYGDKVLANGDIVAHGNGDHGLIIGRETMQPIYDFIRPAATVGPVPNEKPREAKGASGVRLEQNVDGELAPFLVWYAPFLPHTPHNSPQKYVDLYRDRPEIPEHRVPYYAAISQFDDTVGELVRFVEDRGLSEQTMFVFVVDNGWEPDRDRFVPKSQEWDHTKRSKRAPFDFGLRTPILIRWDGHTKPATIDGLVSSVDLVPTLLSAAGIDPAPFRLPGIDLMPSATGLAEIPADRAVFGEIYPGDATTLGNPARDIAYRWVRQGPLKLIVPHSAIAGKPPWNRYLTRPALYDVVTDPAEARNLIDVAQYRETAIELRGLLDRWWLPRSD